MFRIATYNMRKGGAAKVHWSTLLDHHHVDILLAQESYSPEVHLPRAPGDTDRRRNALWAKVGDGAWGSGVFVGHVRPRAVELASFEGWVIGADVRPLPWMARDRLRVFSIHAPAKTQSYYASVHAILDTIAACRGTGDLVIGGDFNVGVSERHATESRTTTSGDRKVQARLQDEFALINVWQTANPDQPLAQTLRWTNKPKEPYHCDGIFVPRSWSRRLLACEVLDGAPWVSLSDHNPVVATFQTGGKCGY